MNTQRHNNAALTVIGLGTLFGLANYALSAPPDNRPQKLSPKTYTTYKKAITRTAEMVNDTEARQLAQRFGLHVLNLTWEDTGRYKGSAVGPNISDMTIQVADRDPKTDRLTVTTMPVIRYPNFSDKSGDLDPRDFTLLVGNQKPGSNNPLRRISLYDFLKNPTQYLSEPSAWKAPKRSLLAPERDSKVLVSAQACFLPVPKSGKATFNPVVFNYQSYEENPAVLTVLATREGTSATVIDNKRDAFETGSAWGQRLFHNAGGMRASLTGERESDFLAKTPNARHDGGVSVGGKESGMNMVLLIQIPLKQAPRPRPEYVLYSMAAPASAGVDVSVESRSRKSNVENAVIGHGEIEGPFTETDNLKIERDSRFPVRVTVQFYKATDNGVVDAANLRDIKQQIDRVYNQSDYVGSLVTEGETGRITEYEGAKVEPPGWWDEFWQRHEKNTGDSREEVIRKLRKLLGADYDKRPVTDLYLRNLLRTRK